MDIGATEEHEHQTMVETVHRDLDQMFRCAHLKGEITSEQAVDILISLWMIKKCQIDIQHGTTRFERTFGQVPITMMNSLDPVPVDIPPILNVDDANFVRLLRKQVLGLLQTHFAAKSVTSRRSLLVKDVKFAASKGKTDDIKAGMWVSHDGKRWQVLRTT